MNHLKPTMSEEFVFIPLKAEKHSGVVENILATCLKSRLSELSIPSETHDSSSETIVKTFCRINLENHKNNLEFFRKVLCNRMRRVSTVVNIFSIGYFVDNK